MEDVTSDSANPESSADQAQSPSTSMELSIRDQAIAELSVIETGIADLRQKYKDVVFDVATTKGMDEAKKARVAIRDPRYKVPHIVKAKKAELKKISDEIVSTGERIVTELKALEDPIDGQITAEEERKEAEKQRKIEEERLRIAAIRDRISFISAVPVNMVGKGSDELVAAIATATATVVDEENFGEFVDEAAALLSSVVEKLNAMLAAARAADEAAAKAEEDRQRLVAEAEELERKRKEIAEAEERLAAAQRADDERKAAAAREESERLAREDQRRAEEHKAQQDAFEAEKAEARRKIDEEQAEARAKAQQTQMAMQEIQGIQQQAAIAISGRLGVREGGTIQCIRDTLQETRDWTIDDRFGDLAGLAQLTKDGVVKAIEGLLAEAEAAEAAKPVIDLSAGAADTEVVDLRVPTEVASALQQASPETLNEISAKLDQSVEAQLGLPAGSYTIPSQLANVVDGKIVIVLSPEQLACALELSPINDGATDDHISVADRDLFLKEVCAQLNNEEEDGSTPLSRCIDNAMVAAVDSGCEGIEISPIKEAA